ncbi:hypothetical protein cypCar_00026074 [Cyprinus carpio]|nr:hypothetical protein cypCar_00026074 [Cyprinus carpio]
MKMGTHQSPKSPRATACDQTCEKEDCDSEGSVSGQHVGGGTVLWPGLFLGVLLRFFFTYVDLLENCSALTAGLRRSFRLSRKEHQGSTKESHPAESEENEFLIYEEVTLYQMRTQDKPRLVVLIGSLGARINELKQKVIAENPHRYGVAVPHTTRPRKSHEKEGVEYHFISKQAFEADIQSNKFIEYGEYKNNQYGTSLESIRSVLARNKVCLVDVQPEALKTLCTSEFKPYVIFVKPCIPEISRQRSSPTSPGRGDNGHITDEDLQDMRQSAEQMEQQYGHLVDRVLVKEYSASACVELRNILERLEREPQWVPVSWVRS